MTNRVRTVPTGSVGGGPRLLRRIADVDSERATLRAGAFGNVSQYDRSWALDEIDSAEPVMTAFVIPNGLRVTLTNGTRERFVVSGRQAWANAIRAAIEARRTQGLRGPT